MSKLSMVTLKLLAGVMLISCAFAEDQASEPTKQEQIQPGTRMMAHAEMVKIQEERAAQMAQAEEEAPAEETAESTSAFDAPKGAFQAGIYSTSHMGAFHNPVLVSLLGDQVHLEDGSIWNVYSGDSYKTLNWFTSDQIVITPNHELFSSYLFKMTNQQTGVTVKCNMQLGPFYNGIYTYWIYAINYYTQEIVLNDGSVWDVSSFDSSVFNQFLVNDTVIIGINDGFLSLTKPNILINVNILNWVRANCY